MMFLEYTSNMIARKFLRKKKRKPDRAEQAKIALRKAVEALPQL